MPDTFPVKWADNGARTEPTDTEKLSGFVCGPPSREHFNWLFWATQDAINNVPRGTVLAGAGLSRSEDGDNGVLDLNYSSGLNPAGTLQGAELWSVRQSDVQATVTTDGLAAYVQSNIQAGVGLSKTTTGSDVAIDLAIDELTGGNALDGSEKLAFLQGTAHVGKSISALAAFFNAQNGSVSVAEGTGISVTLANNTYTVALAENYVPTSGGTFAGRINLLAGADFGDNVLVENAGVLGVVRAATVHHNLDAGNTPPITEQQIEDGTSTARKTISADVLAGALGGYVRKLDAPRTLYVRTDGNDANDGSANTAASAFRQPQAAIDYMVDRFGGVVQDVIIQIGAGTFEPALVENSPLKFFLVGAGNTTIIDGAAGLYAVGALGGAAIDCSSLRLQNASRLVYIGDRSRGSYSDIELGAATNSHLWCGVASVLRPTGLATVTDGAPSHVLASVFSLVDMRASSTSIGSSTSFPTAFVTAAGGNVYASTWNITLGSGASVSGPEYRLIEGGSIFRSPGAEFPGDQAGTTDSTGTYK